MGFTKKASTLIITLLSSLILGCTSEKKSDTIDTAKVDSSEKIVQREVISTSKNRLIGIWTDGESENATVEINQDSIYNVTNLKAISTL